MLQVQLHKYNDEEWTSLILPESSDWSREETDYLLDMCERFDLRFPVIQDRYEVRLAPQHVRMPGTTLPAPFVDRTHACTLSMAPGLGVHAWHCQWQDSCMQLPHGHLAAANIFTLASSWCMVHAASVHGA